MAQFLGRVTHFPTRLQVKMTKSLLQRILRRGDDAIAQAEAFRLPGALHEEVRILLIASGDLTDLLFAMPFVQSVRESYPKAHLGLACGERTSHLAISTDCFQDIIVFDEEQMNPGAAPTETLQAALDQVDWEVAILVGQHPDPGRAGVALASGAVLRVGPAYDKAFPLINCELRSLERGKHPYRRTTTWGRLLGVPLENIPLQWPIAEAARRQMAQLVHFNKPRKDQLLVGVDPGVGKSGTVLAAENLAFLINHLAGHIRCKTILLSSDADDLRQKNLAALLRSEQLDLPRPTLRERLALVEQCDLFISGNTDLFHFAVAMGVPTLGIFTEADGDAWVPPSGGFELLRSVEGEHLSLSQLMEKIDQLRR